MKKDNIGIIVTNITHMNSDKWLPQINAFQEAFVKIGINTQILSNASCLSFVQEHRREIAFCLFFDKDIYLAKAIENLNIRVFNSSETIRICDDKALTYLALEKSDILTPRTVVLPISFNRRLSSFFPCVMNLIHESNISFPLILKERKGSFGDQVYLVKKEEDLKKLFQKLGPKEFLIQEYIKESKGTDYRVYVVGKNVVACAKRVNKKDFRSNVNQGGKMHHLDEIPALITKTAKNASKACNADFSGVDIVINKSNKPLVIEVNSNARTVAIEKTSHVPIADLIAQYIRNNC